MNNSESEILGLLLSLSGPGSLKDSISTGAASRQTDKSTNLTGLLWQLFLLSDVNDSRETGSSARGCPKSSLTLDLVTREPWCCCQLPLFLVLVRCSPGFFTRARVLPVGRAALLEFYLARRRTFKHNHAMRICAQTHTGAMIYNHVNAYTCIVYVLHTNILQIPLD